ncbi:dihydrofolate reductase family protein [Streptomyces sp. NPDC057307]|uniref:dihydrofolate reductase family protein n=1 Tax=Streptomyces sp. NPDC057307 TaxID=3346096 RepID=UPI00363ED943
MTVTVTADMVMSLDGYIAGTDHSVADPAGHGADRIGGWIHAQSSWRERTGLNGGAADQDSDIMREWFESTGAVVMGRLMYDSGVDFWGDNPPFRTPVFVLTNRPAPTLVKEGGTSFTFVTDGIHSALDQAKAVSAGRHVDIAGGAHTVQQYLRARLVDELQLHVIPVLFGAGLRLFDNLGLGSHDLEPIRVVDTPGATHLKYRILR